MDPHSESCLLDLSIHITALISIIPSKAYHDMATHNIEDGTGGMDASIRFELDRPEVCGFTSNTFCDAY